MGITAKEFYRFTFPDNYSGGIVASLDYVDLNFNACRAKQNNNLQRFYERLLNEGRVSRTKYNKFLRTVVGDNQCTNAIEDLLFEKGYKHETSAPPGWTMLYGRGSMISAASFPELWQTIDAGSYIRRICKSCSRSSHKDIIYKRLTSSPAPTPVSPLNPGTPTPPSPTPGTPTTLSPTPLSPISAPTSSACGCGPADGRNQPECV